ncbi:hypothetical protein FN846DRAFT_191326 [Sphaerosporella brunnea]|uniref:Peptidase S1 domain-containing protein n=1 Tax=Sphaerosporella brunnea TaxID=1250544 RepID=A0A5J5ENJ5_9PEZI|nr:hypothetical protein FN846DRAFT_191326 [Sphaerosporella brunnea]
MRQFPVPGPNPMAHGNTNLLANQNIPEKSKIDWCAFSVDLSRMGRNVFSAEDYGDPVVSPTLLSPGTKVVKVGRTTGRQYGTVNGAIVQGWDDGHSTVEIGVIGHANGVFADSGDSGSLCVLEDKQGDLHAAGLVVDKHAELKLAIVTPMWALLEDVSRELGESVGFWEGR